jgi:hypothetical protein
MLGTVEVVLRREITRDSSWDEEKMGEKKKTRSVTRDTSRINNDKLGSNASRLQRLFAKCLVGIFYIEFKF